MASAFFLFSFSFLSSLTPFNSNDMHAIGIDMSKDTFHAAFSDTHVREFNNSEDGITAFLAMAEACGHAKRGAVIGVECTGVYHLFLCVRLFERGWDIRVINPMLTAQMITAGLRMVKSDRKDARIVRMAVQMGKGYPFRDTPEILALKALVSEREDIVRMRADLKRRQHAHHIRARACGVTLHDSYAPAFAAFDIALDTIDKRLQDYAADTQRLLPRSPGSESPQGLSSSLTSVISDALALPNSSLHMLASIRV
jgi:transposase